MKANVLLVLGIDKIACTFIPNLTLFAIVKKLLLPFIIIVLLVGCKKEEQELKFEDLAIEQVSEENCIPEEENCTFISIQIPWAINTDTRSKKINQKVEKHIIQLIDSQEEHNLSSLEALSEKFIDDYEASSKEFPEYNIPWEASVVGKISHSSPDLVSIEFDLALFTGGAHGYTSVTYLNFNPKTGDQLLFKDLFKDEFKSYAEKLFRKKNDIPEDQSINSTGLLFENDTFQLPKNIGFSKNKIILRYNAYEVASYSEGGIQLEIPMKDVGEFIKIQ